MTIIFINGKSNIELWCVEMAEPLPKWIMKHYSTLWREFKNKEFIYEDASKTLNEKKMMSLILSELKKNGWLNVKLDPEDSRKRIYQLKNPNEVINEMEK